MQFRLLGPLEVDAGHRALVLPSGRGRALLAALLLYAPRVVPVDELIDHLWGSTPPANARPALHTQFARLRRALGDNDGRLIRTQPPGYVIDVDPDQVDAARFDALVRVAQQAEAPIEVAARLTEALALWRGPALADIASESLHREFAGPLDERRLDALEGRIEADLRLGRHTEIIAELRTLTAEQPLRERYWAQLMVALYRAGRQADALDAYRRARRTLVEALGIEPGEELRRLEHAVLIGDPELAVPADQVPAEPITAGPVPEPAGGARDPWQPQQQLPIDTSNFVGREELVHDLVEVLSPVDDSDVVPVVAVYGSAGVGKSALALRVAHWVRAAYPDGQWYASLSGGGPTPRYASDVLAELLLTSGLDGAAIPAGEAARAAALRARLAGRRVLLLLDDARDAAHVEPLLPGAAGSAAIVTSRVDLRGLGVRHGAHTVELDVLAPAEAQILIGRILGANRVRAEPEATAELTERCARLPLALHIAAANLARHPRRLIAEHVAELHGHDRLRRLSVAGDRRAAVRAAFDTSYQRLPPPAARMFRLLGLLPGADATAETAGVLLDAPPEVGEELLEDLAGAGLLRHHTPGRYRFHDLLRLYAAERAHNEDGEAAGAEVVHRLLSYLLARVSSAAELFYPWAARMEPPASTPTIPAFADADDAWAWLEQERANLVAGTRFAADRGPAELAWRLADALRGFFYTRRYVDDWRTSTEAGLRAAEANGEVSAQAAMQHSLGLLQACLSNYSDARDHYLRAITLRRAAGLERENGPSINNLAIVHEPLGRADEGIAWLREGLALDRDTGSRIGVALKLSNIADALLGQGRLVEALGHLEESQAIQRELGDGEVKVQTLTTYAYLRYRMGEIDEARAVLRHTLALSERTGDVLGEAYALHCFAEINRATGDLQQSQLDAARALEIARRERLRDAEIESLNALGTALSRLGDHETALALLSEARELGRPIERWRGSVESRLRLGEALLAAGQPEPALTWLEEALATSRQCGFRGLEGVALTALGRHRWAEGNPAEAIALVERAIRLHHETGHVLAEHDAEGLLSEVRARPGVAA